MCRLRVYSLLALGGALFGAARTSLISKIPISFEPAVSGGFVAQGRGYLLHVTARENVLTLPDPASKIKSSLRVTFPGSLVGRMEPLDPRASRSNYFQGSDPRKWRTNVSQFAKIRIVDLYRGIDLVYYGSGHTL